jgi:serine/threonine protein phosphatase PrpC
MPNPVQVIAFAQDEVSLMVEAVSDIGVKRVVNEDSFLATAPVFLVADGMGGHAHGDLASQAVARTFAAAIPFGRVTTAAEVLAALTESNAAVHGLSAGASESSSMAGTTVSGLALVASESQSSLHWMVFNIGDSRVYSWDDGLVQLTVDHSAVQELIDEGSITTAEAIRHPERNVVTRAIGVDDEVDADVWLLPVGGRQLFLICSDGLTKELPDESISALVADAVARDAVDGLASDLVDSAIRAGGLDNVTVIVVAASLGPIAADRGDTGDIPAFLEQTLPRV